MGDQRRNILFMLILNVAAFGIIVSAHPVYAVVGQLDWQLPTQPTAITLPVATPGATADTKALDNCRKNNDELNISLKNCQDATKLLKDASDASNANRRMYLTTTVISSSIAIVLAILLLVVLVTKKNPPPLPPSTSSSVS